MRNWVAWACLPALVKRFPQDRQQVIGRLLGHAAVDRAGEGDVGSGAEQGGQFVGQVQDAAAQPAFAHAVFELENGRPDLVDGGIESVDRLGRRD